MKLSDIQKLVDAGYLTPAQQEQVVEQFKLREESSRFLAIISFIGAVMVGAGIILLLAANWEEIPRLIKIVVGIGLMAGAHALGGWLRSDAGGNYGKTGETLHLLGSGLFLANIALLGQIYHLAGDPPDAILLWVIGIGALPWLLHSKAQHILVLLAFGLWVFLYAMEETSFFSVGESEWLVLLCALVGLAYYGAGYFLYRTRYEDFASSTQKLGILAFHGFSYPMTWGFGFERGDTYAQLVLVAFAAAAGLLLLAGAQRERRLALQWRVVWPLSLAGATLVLLGALAAAPEDWYDDYYYHWIVSVALFILCLVQINVALLIQSIFLLNLSVVFVALHIITVYLTLFGTMAFTGFMFILSGLFLIVFGVYLEKKRRSLVKKLKATPPPLVSNV